MLVSLIIETMSSFTNIGKNVVRLHCSNLSMLILAAMEREVVARIGRAEFC